MPAGTGSLPDSKEVLLPQRVIGLSPRRSAADNGQIAKDACVQILVNLGRARLNSAVAHFREATLAPEERAIGSDDREGGRCESLVRALVPALHRGRPRVLVRHHGRAG